MYLYLIYQVMLDFSVPIQLPIKLTSVLYEEVGPHRG